MLQVINIEITTEEIQNLTKYNKTNQFPLISEQKQDIGFARLIRSLNSVDLLELIVEGVVYYVGAKVGIINTFEPDAGGFKLEGNTIVATIPQEVFDAIIG